MDVSLVVIGNEAYGNSPAEIRAAPGGGRGGYYACRCLSEQAGGHAVHSEGPRRGVRLGGRPAAAVDLDLALRPGRLRGLGVSALGLDGLHEVCQRSRQARPQQDTGIPDRPVLMVHKGQ